MPLANSFFVTFLFALSAPALAQSAPPPGTITPVELNSSISTRTQPHQSLSARVMQDVALPSGKIRAGARVIGHIVSVEPATASSGPQVTFAFDTLKSRGHTIPIATDLRAMASFVEVNEARIPLSGPDRGTPESERTTLLVGGDVDYKSDGPVMEGSHIVGKPIFNGVLTQVRGADESGYRCAMAGNGAPQ